MAIIIFGEIITSAFIMVIYYWYANFAVVLQYDSGSATPSQKRMRHTRHKTEREEKNDFAVPTLILVYYCVGDVAISKMDVPKQQRENQYANEGIQE